MSDYTCWRSAWCGITGLLPRHSPHEVKVDILTTDKQKGENKKQQEEKARIGGPSSWLSHSFLFDYSKLVVSLRVTSPRDRLNESAPRNGKYAINYPR